MKILNFDIHIFANMGDINEVKQNKLSEIFKGSFSVSNEEKDLIVLEKEGAIIMISPKRIIYRITNENLLDKLDQVNNDFITILDSLMVSFEGKGALDITGENVITSDSFEDSMSMEVIELKNKKMYDIKGLKGIGLRFISETDIYRQDFKKEPYLANNNSYFYKITRIYDKNKITISELVNECKHIYDNRENEFIEG